MQRPVGWLSAGAYACWPTVLFCTRNDTVVCYDDVVCFRTSPTVLFCVLADSPQVNAGINVRKGTITNMLDENVVQPLLVSTSAIGLATECVRMILKIDDIVITR